MDPKRAIIAAVLCSMTFAPAAFAQVTSPADPAPSISSSEFGRSSGGVIELVTKSHQPFSGSLSLSASRGQLPFGSSASGRGYGATLGGSLVQDRVWFFASAERTAPLFGSGYNVVNGAPAQATASTALDSRVLAQIGDRQSLAAMFSTTRTNGTPAAPFVTAPSSFLSLHYTGIVSDRMFVTGSVSGFRRSSGN
jgi:hypothetical protein